MNAFQVFKQNLLRMGLMTGTRDKGYGLKKGTRDKGYGEKQAGIWKI